MIVARPADYSPLSWAGLAASARSRWAPERVASLRDRSTGPWHHLLVLCDLERDRLMYSWRACSDAVPRHIWEPRHQ